jgi:hypothetical protein
MKRSHGSELEKIRTKVLRHASTHIFLFRDVCRQLVRLWVSYCVFRLHCHGDLVDPEYACTGGARLCIDCEEARRERGAGG